MALWIITLCGCTVVLFSDHISIDTEIDSPDIETPIKRITK